MFVKQLVDEAQKQLITVRIDSHLTDAAKALSILQAEIIVVCDLKERAVGVITKSDLVREMTNSQRTACQATAAAAMTRDLVCCRLDDEVSDVWRKMKEYGLRRVPIIDGDSRPVGIINARDVLQAMLINATNEVDLLRDYVMGIGYH